MLELGQLTIGAPVAQLDRASGYEGFALNPKASRRFKLRRVVLPFCP
jgi:hypothetical protein